MFTPERLTLARKRRKLTRKSLAERSGVAVDTVSRIEKGQNTPDEETVESFAAALNYPFEFFFLDEAESIEADSVSFRSFSKMTAKLRDAALMAGTLGLELSEWVDERFSLPKPDLIDLSYETDPEAAAQALRSYWGVGARPIGHLIALLESRGIRVLALSEETAAVNAFSFWKGEVPFIFLNSFKTAESSNFDIAHELGHLVMHMHGDPKDIKGCEREADAFASAFLMPESDVKSRVPRRIDIDTVLKAKSRWRVSAMAMTYRLRSLGLLSEYNYKSMCIELSKMGYRAGEPRGIEREVSKVWGQVLTQLWSEGLSLSHVAQELRAPLDEVEGLIGGIMPKKARPSRSDQVLLSIVRAD